MEHAPVPEPSDRYLRQVTLPGFGQQAQDSLRAARVLVIGAGGLGSSTIPALAAAGVGTIGIIDDDLVESSNLHRQYLHSPADVGRNKVDSAVASISALNPATHVVAHATRLTSQNALEIFAGYDVVLDGSDNFPTRYLANDAAALTGIPLVWGAVSQYAGQAGVCWAGHGPQYRDLFPTPPPAGSVLSCAVGGVLPTVCAVVGSIMATETIKLITGVGAPLLGKVTTFDALTGGFREIAYGIDPTAEPITGLIDYDLFCGITPPRDTVTADELASEIESGAALTLLDVRETWEAEIASLPGTVLLPLGSLETALEHGFTDLDPSDPIVVYCHHGVRSATALEILERFGFTAVRHLEGGIDAWARRVDPTLARY
ncbi:ThiF family adenylyltransferase [Glaciihabitans sp. dw_435]|uniref:ThiF family adenylyltransferase n=1 Tax=Glaciihabitans sp. dw_435 TaxID=2720081 RepID=UPI001BD4D2D5|nr:ThiF family adenylyltransferase [Glaciihabitans sp. dw_435]